MAFVLVRRKPTEQFTYGLLGRLEDLAGLLTVRIMALSALVAGYEAIMRFFHPRPVAYLGIVACIARWLFLAMRPWPSFASGWAGRSAVRRSSQMGIMPEGMAGRV